MSVQTTLEQLRREIDAAEGRLVLLRGAEEALEALVASTDAEPRGSGPEPPPKPARASRKTSPPSYPAGSVLPGQLPDQSARLAAENGNPDPGERTRQVLEEIRQSTDGLSKNAIMARTGLSREQVTRAVQKLARDGRIRGEGATRLRRFHATEGNG